MMDDEKAVHAVEAEAVVDEVEEMEGEKPKGDAFSSRFAFIVASMASAVGLGSVWQFPYLVFENGGPIFVLVYILANIVLGIPMLCTEFAFGQVWQQTSVPVMTRVSQRFVGVGFSVVVASLCIVAYYMQIMAWVCIYLVNSFLTIPPWALTPADIQTCEAITTGENDCKANILCTYNTASDTCGGYILGKAIEFFNSAANVGVEGQTIVFSGWMLLAFGVMWTIEFLFLMLGARIMGYILYVTMALPSVVLIILLVVGVTLPGAGLGITAYIGFWDWSVFSTDPGLWGAALGQVFFALSLCEGVMITYSSYNMRTHPCGQDSIWVALGVIVFSLISGFAVFSVAGYISHQSGVPVSQLPMGGTQLAFETYPVGTVGLGYPWTQIVNCLFFIMLLLIGISSAVSLLEPTLATIIATKHGRHWKRWKIVGVACLLLFIVDIVFCFDFGLFLQNTIGKFVSDVGLVFNGIMETLALLWIWNYEVPNKKVGAKVNLIYTLSFWIGINVFFILMVFIPKPTGYIVGGAGLGCTLVWCYGVVPFVWSTKVTEEGEVLSTWDKWTWLVWGGVDRTVGEFNSVVSHDKPWYFFMKFTFWYSFLSKFFIPILLVGAFWSLLAAKSTWVFEGQSVVWTVIGAVMLFCLMIGMSLFGIIFPQYVIWLRRYPDDGCMIVELYPGPFKLSYRDAPTKREELVEAHMERQVADDVKEAVVEEAMIS